MANAAGVQFISAAQLRDEFASKAQEGEEEEEGEEEQEEASDDSDWETESDDESSLPANPNYSKSPAVHAWAHMKGKQLFHHD